MQLLVLVRHQVPIDPVTHSMYKVSNLWQNCIGLLGQYSMATLRTWQVEQLHSLLFP